jgi:hypothetical protein
MVSQERMRRSTAEVVREFLDETVLHDPPLAPTVAVGPLVWGIKTGDGRHWYFILASADFNGQFHLDCLQIANDDQELAEQTRQAAMLELATRRAIVVIDFDDEVRFAGFCAETWPSKRTRSILAAIKADYASR